MYGFSTYAQTSIADAGVNPNTEFSVSGVSATGVINSLSVNTDNNLSVTGVSAVGVVGSILVEQGATVNLEGITMSANTSSCLVWDEIPKEQTPNWQEINT